MYIIIEWFQYIITKNPINLLINGPIGKLNSHRSHFLEQMQMENSLRPHYIYNNDSQKHYFNT